MAKKKKGRSAAFMKNLRRKFGLGEFKGKNSGKKGKTIKRSQTSSFPMARRRRSTARRVSRRVKSSLNANGVAIGAAGYTFVRDTALDLFNNVAGNVNLGGAVQNASSVVEAGAGWWLTKRGKSRFTRGVGAAMLVMGVNQLLSGVNLFGGANANANNNQNNGAGDM